MQKLELDGQTFGRLTVLCEDGQEVRSFARPRCPQTNLYGKRIFGSTPAIKPISKKRINDKLYPTHRRLPGSAEDYFGQLRPIDSDEPALRQPANLPGIQF